MKVSPGAMDDLDHDIVVSTMGFWKSGEIYRIKRPFYWDRDQTPFKLMSMQKGRLCWFTQVVER